MKRPDKGDKALTTIRLVGAEDAVKAFLAVIRNPCALAAVVVSEEFTASGIPWVE